MKSFAEISWLDFPRTYYQTVQKEIESKGKDYILKVDQNEFIEYLIEKYRIEPLKILTETEDVSEPIKASERIVDMFGRQITANSLTFKISYQYTGHGGLFRVQPNPHNWESSEINVDFHKNIVSFSMKIYRQNVEEFNNTKASSYSKAFSNLNKINDNLSEFNRDYEKVIESMFINEKNKYKTENDFFAAINIKVNPDTASIFTAPSIKKKIIKQPVIEKNREFSSIPTMSHEMYNDVLKVIYDSGKSMEKKPDLYKGRDEEGLRDQFLFVLETRYEGTTATGETFNRGGKADIILKFADDGSNLFIAECKFWHGSSEFLKAISQLFDRYLTWRDSKVAVMIFVKNKDISNVLSTIKSDINQHEYFLRHIVDRGESSFSYEFHLPQDKGKKVDLEIMTFHFDKE